MKTNNNLLATSAGSQPVNPGVAFTDGELRELQDAMTFWLECRQQRVKEYKRWGNPTAAKMVSASVRRSKSILAKLGAGT